MTNTTCKNCGGDIGIHQYATGQCPINGHEAPLDQEQDWRFTRFETDDNRDERIAKLELALNEIDSILRGELPVTRQVKAIVRKALENK